MAANPRDIEEELQDLQVHLPDNRSVFSDETVPLDAAELARQTNDADTQAKIGRLEATVATLPLLIQQMQELQRELKLQAEARVTADRRNEQLSAQLSEQQRTITTLNEQLAQTQAEQQRTREAQVAAEAAQKLKMENDAKLAREERARAEAARLAAEKEAEKKRLADLNKRIGPNGATRLQLAIQAGDVQNVATLLEAKADPNIANNDGTLPLDSVGWGSTFFCMLLENGADPSRVKVRYRQDRNNNMIYITDNSSNIFGEQYGNTSLSGYANLTGHKYGNPSDANLGALIRKHYKPRSNPS